jgi:hypothetical protein
MAVIGIGPSMSGTISSLRYPRTAVVGLTWVMDEEGGPSGV